MFNSEWTQKKVQVSAIGPFYGQAFLRFPPLNRAAKLLLSSFFEKIGI
jgi:hypothetical protein